MAEPADRVLVKQFFAERGVFAEHIPETTSKTPDFKFWRGAEVVAYCEVKSPQDVFAERVEDAILEGSGGIIETGYGNDYRQGRCIASRLLKKSFAVDGEGGVVAVIEGQLDFKGAIVL